MTAPHASNVIAFDIERLEREVEKRKMALVTCNNSQRFDAERAIIEKLERAITSRTLALADEHGETIAPPLRERGNGSWDARDEYRPFVDWDALDAKAEREQAEQARRKGKSANFADFRAAEPPPLLSYVDLKAELTPRRWLIPERIPSHNVTLLSGEGGAGKSILLMQLSGATVLGHDWIGTLPEFGPVLYVSCEEDDEEVNRRMEDVAALFHISRAEMEQAGLRVLSFAGKDAVLACPDRSGIMKPTPLFESIKADAIKLRPKLIVVDNAADVFAGKENDRAQTRQFLTMLRGLAIEAEGAVILSAHPSLTGISTDTGLSGNTQWHNGVRARMYFKPAPGVDDTTLRVLEVKKNNYGPISETILLRWKNGVYIPEPARGLARKLGCRAGPRSALHEAIAQAQRAGPERQRQGQPILCADRLRR
jgi:hypothetical protein